MILLPTETPKRKSATIMLDELSTLLSTVTVLQQNLSATQAQLTASQAELADALQFVQTLAKQLNQTNATCAATSQSVVAAEASIRTLQTTAADGQNNVTALQTLTDSLSTKMLTAESSLARLDTRGKEAVTCDAASKGQMRVLDESIEFCDGNRWKPSYEAPLGSSRGTAASSCQAIYEAGEHQFGKHKYWLFHPVEGTNAEDVYVGLCSFTADGDTVTVVDLGG